MIIKAKKKISEADVLEAMDKNSGKGAALFTALMTQRKAERKAVNKVKPMAVSPLEKERIEERKQIITNAAISLTTNLPRSSDALDVNWNVFVLVDHIAKAGHESSLQDDILWHGQDGKYSDLNLKVGARTIKFTKEDYPLLDSAIGKLISWSGAKKKLTESKKQRPAEALIKSALAKVGNSYLAQQSKKKSSEWYLGRLDAVMRGAELAYTPATATKEDALAALTLATAEQAILLGFFKDKSNNVNIDCSDSKYGVTELPRKIILPYFKLILEKSSVAGKLKGTAYPTKFMEGVISMLTNIDIKDAKYKTHNL